MVKQCDRCNKWFNSSDSRVCDPCWVDMGQMSLELEEEDADDRHPVDSIFDRDREVQGKDW